jgi:hypothetical protein
LLQLLTAAFGTKRTSQSDPAMSAIGSKADIAATKRNFNLRPAGLVLEVDVSERLPAAIGHAIAKEYRERNASMREGS